MTKAEIPIELISGVNNENNNNVTIFITIVSAVLTLSKKNIEFNKRAISNCRITTTTTMF